MKGILVVGKFEINDKHILLRVLREHCEKIEKDSEFIKFYSKEGSLMTMICALLDQGVTYKIEFESKAISNGDS